MNQLSKVLLAASVTLAVPGAFTSQDRGRPTVENALPRQDGGKQFPSLDLPEGESILRVQIGKTLLVRSARALKRIAISDPNVASAVTVSPNEVMINGAASGSVTLLLWDEQDQVRRFEVEVGIDLEGLRETVRQVFPDEHIAVEAAGKGVVLSGTVSSKATMDRAMSVAQMYTTQAVNLLAQTENFQTILLQVRFAEVNRSAIQELGFNLFSTGAANTIGSTGTQQFGTLSTNAGALPNGTARGRDPQQPNLASGAIGNPSAGSPAVFGMSDLLNVFLFRPDLNLGMTIQALQQRNLIQILAEPNILARNGVEATFHAGGEFPFPVVQSSLAGNAVTIVFKEFGIRLKFTPNIQSSGAIRLKVAPEASALDFANALTISGFLIPAISTRRVETEVELRDGQSFAIAGLINNQLRDAASKVPVLGDIPIIGQLFRSRGKRRDNTELMVMVTPRLVQPLEAGESPTLPKFPQPFDDKQLSGERPGGQAPKPESGKGK